MSAERSQRRRGSEIKRYNPDESGRSAGGRQIGRNHVLRENSMAAADLRRMFSSRHFYIMLGLSLIMPILILVMTTMMDGSVSVDPQTGAETTVEGFHNTWEIIGTKSGISLFGGADADNGMQDDAAGTVSSDAEESLAENTSSAAGAQTGNAENTSQDTGTNTSAEPGAAENAGLSDSTGTASSGMGLTTMCNINLVYFLAIVLAGIFISEDFRSGFAKNLFAVRTRKRDYVNSKIFVCSAAGVLMVLAFFIGSMAGGKIAGLPFTMDGFNGFNVLMCMAAKICLVPVFISIGVVVSCLAKANVWIAVFGSLMAGILLFMTISMMTPINATVLHAG